MDTSAVDASLSPGAAAVLRRDGLFIAGVEKLRFFPLAVESGDGSYLVEVGGRRLLDLSASWTAAGLGYGHPEIADAIASAAKAPAGASGLSSISGDAVALAERLAGIVPMTGDLRVYLGNAGTDANETALQACRRATGKRRVVAFIGGYHGGMGLARAASQVLNPSAPADPGITFLPYPDPLRPDWFIGPMDAARAAFNLAADQDAAHSALIKSGGKISISHPGAMSDQTVQAIRDAWQTMHSTPEGASRPLILREGMKAEKISESTSNVLESRRFSIQEVARAVGIPPEMLYQQGGGALASQSETARAYVDGALAQWVSAWESEITRKLCRPGEHARLDVDVLLRGNMRDAGMALSKLVLAGIMSGNDARHRLGLPPQEGLDDAKVSMPGGMSAVQGDKPLAYCLRTWVDNSSRRNTNTPS